MNVRGYIATVFAMLSWLALAYGDEWIETTDSSVVRYDLADGSVAYAFTNSLSGVQVTPVGASTLAELLVVGGGGSGGGTIGGGGGGGQVLSAAPMMIFQGATLSVGAGGQPSADVWKTGSGGGSTSLSLVGGSEYLAYGGGAGKGWNGANPAAASASNPYANGGGGSNSTGKGGVGFDHRGGDAYACGGNDNSPGGGAGAGADGGSGAADRIAGSGGEGFFSSIAGERLDYGAGGGGGGGNAITHSAAGGPSAGDGGLGNKETGGSPTPGGDGLDGRGGGGGGGAFTPSTKGGRGGTGTVILRLISDGKLALTVSVECGEADARRIAEAAVGAGVALVGQGDPVELSAGMIECAGTDYAPYAYRVDTLSSGGWINGEQTAVENGAGSYSIPSMETSVRITWFYRVTKPRLGVTVMTKDYSQLRGEVSADILVSDSAYLWLEVYSDPALRNRHGEDIALAGGEAVSRGEVVPFATEDLPPGGSYYARIRANDGDLIGYSSVICLVGGSVYVSGSGSDGVGTGVADNPFRSIAKALDANGDGTVFVGPGVYSPETSGDTFGYVIAGSATFAAWDGEADPDEVDPQRFVLDGGNVVDHLFTCGTGGDIVVRGLTICNSLNTLVKTQGGSVTFANVVATQSLSANGTGNYNSPGDYNNGVLRTQDATAVTFRNCRVSDIRRDTAVQLHYSADMLSDIVMEDCAFIGCTVRFGLISETSGVTKQLRCVFSRCTFEDDEVTNKDAQHDVYGASVFWARGNGNPKYSTVFDRCRFVNLRGRTVFSGNRTALKVYNSYFEDCDVTGWTIGGYNASAAIANCTFVRGKGGFTSRGIKTTITDSIFEGVEDLTFIPSDGKFNNPVVPSDLVICNSIFHDTGVGTGYNESSSSDNIETDPLLEDGRPLPYSPAIDSGVGGVMPATYTLDLAGNARIADNSGSGTPRMDIGCYESTFAAEPGPGFLVPVPGLGSGFRGQSYEIPVRLQNAAGENFPLYVSVACGEGLTCDGGLLFESDGETRILRFTATAGASVGRRRITLSADGFAPVSYDFDIGTVQVSLGGSESVYVHVGDTVEMPLSMALDGAVSPSDIPVSVSGISGEAAAAEWSGVAVIARGESASEGHLSITGLRTGVSVVTLEAGEPFAESGATTFELKVIVYDGGLSVDSAGGSDDDGDGVLRPFRSVAAALSVAQRGDSLRLADGTYSAATGERFPIRLDGVSIIGGGGAVLDAGDSADHVVEFVLTRDTANVLSGLVLRNSLSAAVRVSESTVEIRGCTFAQDRASDILPGGVMSFGMSFTTVDGCTFRGIRRRACCYQSGETSKTESSADIRKMTICNSLFEDNTNAYAAVSADIAEFVKNVEVSGCVFRRNVNVNTAKLHVAWPCSCIYLHGGSHAYRLVSRCVVDRCSFFGNTACSTVAFDYLYGTASVCNSVFADESTSDGVLGTAYSSQVSVENCTFVRNSGGYHAATISNSIFVDDAGIGSSSRNEGISLCTLRNPWLFRCERGNESEMAFLGTVTEGVDPLLRNAFVPSSDPSFDARLKPYSPCVDAGDSDMATTELDRDGNPRVADTLGGGAKVDLGAYEETFYAEPQPTFRVERPGIKGVFAGGSASVSVSIAGTGADRLEFPVAATVTYPDGVSGAADIVFQRADETKTLDVSVAGHVTDGVYPLAFRDASARVADGVLDLRVGHLSVAVGIPEISYMRIGDVARAPVRLSIDGATASADIGIELSSVSGNGIEVAWEGEPVIPAGAQESVGYLVVRAVGQGRATFSLSADVPFAGTSSQMFSAVAVAYPGFVYVDPASGSDDVPEGTEMHPFKTLGAALRFVSAGDEIRLLPATYSAESGESFPFDPGAVAVRGWEDGKPAARGRVILDGGGVATSIVSHGGESTSVLSGLHLRNTSDVLVGVGQSSIVISNCLFTQEGENMSVAGGLQLNNKSRAFLSECRFEAMRRLAAVYLSSITTDGINQGQRLFSAVGTEFVGNHSKVASVGSAYGGGKYGLYEIALTNCLFQSNTTVDPSDSVRVWDSYPSSALMLIQGSGGTSARVSIDRTRFIGNGGCHLIAGDWCSEVRVSNCLFKNNEPVISMLYGYQLQMKLHGCTFCGNDGTYTGNQVIPVFYNCIFANERKPIKTIASPYAKTAHSGAKLYATLLFNTVRNGDGVDPILVDDETKIIDGDPLLRDNGGIRVGSAAVDRGESKYALGDFDLLGGPRQRGKAVDLGCCECPASPMLIFVR